MKTDLPKVSYLFCALFLPGANLWIIGSMMAFNSAGWNSFFKYQELIAHLNAQNLRHIVGLALNI